VPAGFEIETRPGARAADVTEFSFLEETTKPTFAQASDREFTAMVEVEGKIDHFKVAYVVRAVTPGRFVAPEGTVNDIDTPEDKGVAAAFEVEIARALQ
jgi:uncharacterized protein YfaS (alpha-2-macroglobulin family)